MSRIGISRRRSIHDTETLQHEDSDKEDERFLDETEENSVSRPPRQNKRTQISSINNDKTASEPPFLLWKFVPLLCLVLFVILAYTNSREKSCSLKILQNAYPKETDSVWKQLQLGLEMVLNQRIENPAVYLLAHHGKQSSFNLIDKIAHQASKCFGKNLLTMERDDFLLHSDSDDYGYSIEKYKTKIREGNVFLIANLNEIPPRAARAFHAICDTHSPIKKNVVIFLSLKIQENKEGNPHSVAEETLRELWGSELGENELDPLITRVTDQVLILKS